jgi:hypothetical protein
MKSTATPAQLRAVERRIEAWDDVIRWAHSSHGVDEYVLDLVHEAVEPAEVRKPFERLPGVHDVYVRVEQESYPSEIVRHIEECPGSDHNVVVWMDVRTWNIQEAAVRAVVDADPRMTLVRTVDRATALAAARAASPGRYPDMTVAHVPVSFEISVPAGTDAGIVHELETLGGVDLVTGLTDCDRVAARGVRSGS